MLRRLLSKLAYNHGDVWERAMLEIYSDVVQQLVRRARMGLRAVNVTPYWKALGDHEEYFDREQVAEVMRVLLRAEGLDAEIVQRTVLRVRWDGYPKHWEEDN